MSIIGAPVGRDGYLDHHSIVAGIWKSRWKAEYLMAGTWRDDERLKLFYQAVELYTWSGRLGPAISRAAAAKVNRAMWKLHASVLHHRAVDDNGLHGTVEAYMARSAAIRRARLATNWSAPTAILAKRWQNWRRWQEDWVPGSKRARLLAIDDGLATSADVLTLPSRPSEDVLTATTTTIDNIK